MDFKQKYIKDVRRLFPVYGKREKDFMMRFKQHVLECDALPEHVTYNELVEEFGSPIEVLQNYYDSIESDYILRKMNTRRIITYVGIIICILAIGVSLWKTIVINQGHENAMDENIKIVEISLPMEVNE